METAANERTFWTAEETVKGYHHNEWSSTEEERREGRESVHRRKEQRETLTRRIVASESNLETNGERKIKANRISRPPFSCGTEINKYILQIRMG